MYHFNFQEIEKKKVLYYLEILTQALSYLTIFYCGSNTARPFPAR